MKLRNFVSILVFCCLIASVAEAKKLENLFDDWHVLSTMQGKDKVCYIASVPKDEQGNYKKRSEPYLLISLFKDRDPEVSISAGYPYKAGAAIKLSIGDKRFELKKLQGEVAWAESEILDKQIISAMKAGSKIEARATSSIGSYSIDTYSLKGITKAYNKMLELCKPVKKAIEEAVKKDISK